MKFFERFQNKKEEGEKVPPIESPAESATYLQDRLGEIDLRINQLTDQRRELGERYKQIRQEGGLGRTVAKKIDDVEEERRRLSEEKERILAETSHQ